jgi:hypothetical protein
MPSLPEWMESIGTSGKDLLKDQPEAIKDYVPFQIINGMCQNMDTVMFANEMNKLPGLSKAMQYKFLLRSISKKKRFSKWAKIEVLDNQDDISLVANYYSVNMERAKIYISLLLPEDLAVIRLKSDMGGCSMPKGRKSS